MNAILLTLQNYLHGPRPLVAIGLCLPLSVPLASQVYVQKISDFAGGFTGVLDDDDRFGYSVAHLGDLDGDGLEEMAVSAYKDDDGGTMDPGAVWILSLNGNGTVNSHQKISQTEGGFTGFLDNSVEFGDAVICLGDLDGDGVADIAVGSGNDNDGGSLRGAVWILFLNSDGTVKAHQKISQTAGGFTGTLPNLGRFGFSLASLGDLDGDGVGDVAAGAYLDSDGGTGRGAVWVLFLNSNGTVKTQQKISDTQGNFTGTLDDFNRFGRSVASLGDLDGDGIGDIAVGASTDSDGGTNSGAIWVLFLNSDGTVKAHQKISPTQGGGPQALGDNFGRSVASFPDLNGDGVVDLCVGAYLDDDGGFNRGAVYFLFLDTDGTVKSHLKISDTAGHFSGTLDNSDFFGTSVAPLVDLNGDGILEFAVGAFGDDDGGTDRGALWILRANFVEATAVVNNGQGINLDIQSAPPAILGNPWAATITVVDPSHPPTGILVLLFHPNSLSTGPRISLGGPVTELLIGTPVVQPCPPFQSYAAGTGIACPLVVIPDDLALVGSPWCTQVAVGTPTAGFTLTNSVCGVVGMF